MPKLLNMGELVRVDTRIPLEADEKIIKISRLKAIPKASLVRSMILKGLEGDF